jgi:hypothetical protein
MMKIFAITNARGEVIATARETQSDGTDAPFGGRPVPGAGCKLHEVTLPHALQHIRSAPELHREVAKLIQSKTSDRA